MGLGAGTFGDGSTGAGACGFGPGVERGAGLPGVVWALLAVGNSAPVWASVAALVTPTGLEEVCPERRGGLSWRCVISRTE